MWQMWQIEISRMNKPKTMSHFPFSKVWQTSSPARLRLKQGIFLSRVCHAVSLERPKSGVFHFKRFSACTSENVFWTLFGHFHARFSPTQSTQPGSDWRQNMTNFKRFLSHLSHCHTGFFERKIKFRRFSRRFLWQMWQRCDKRKKGAKTPYAAWTCGKSRFGKRSPKICHIFKVWQDVTSILVIFHPKFCPFSVLISATFYS